MGRAHFRIILWGLIIVLVGGCLPALPDNTAAPTPERTTLRQSAGAVFSSEPGLTDAVWVDIPRTAGGGTVGGYLSESNATRPALIILLHGASTFDPHGSTVDARSFGENFGRPYRDAGYRTFSLKFTECGGAYGLQDTADLVQVIDWLNTRGKAALGVEQVYSVGYSSGATAALVANRQRQITAAAVICPLTEPTQLQQWSTLYSLVGTLYPNNTGMCHAASTVATYGPPWSPGWDNLNTVAHVRDLKSPMLVAQGTKDEIFDPSNSQHLDAAYHDALSAGAVLPPVQFLYLEGQNHFTPSTDPNVTKAILAFFEQFAGATATH
jgi:pimeloyl-ACP methyl ester carboxylesterase